MGNAFKAAYEFGGLLVDASCKDSDFLTGLQYSFMATVGFVVVMVTDSIGLMDYSLEPRIRRITSISATWVFVFILAFTLFFNLYSATFYHKVSWQVVFFCIIPEATFIFISILRLKLGYEPLSDGDTLSSKRKKKNQ